MQKRILIIAISMLLIAAPLLPAQNTGEADIFLELVGQVKNSPPAGPGLPSTSNQYGYITHLEGLDDSDLFAAGEPQGTSTALLTFYNDSITERVITQGTLRVVTREGTMTIYYDPSHNSDFATPSPDTFRDGTPVLTAKFRHQVILDALGTTNPYATGLFFVTWSFQVTSAEEFQLNGTDVRIAKVGQKFRLNLVGQSDPTGVVDGKFAASGQLYGREESH